MICFHHFPKKAFSLTCFGMLLFFLTVFPLCEELDALPLPSKTKRIVFLGNSITYNGQYIKDIEVYFRYKYPNRTLEFINVGLSSETVSGLSEPGHADGKFPRPDLHERLERVLRLTKPDLVFACYGMNDGIYMPLDETRFQKFREGIQLLHEQVLETGAEIVHLTPPVYDELNGEKKGYDRVLAQYGDWLIECRKVEKWQVVDLHGPMQQFLEEKREINPDFSFAADGVHPDALGHWVMAREILLFLKERKVAGAANIREVLKGKPQVDQVIKLVGERQNITRDAWLSETGHLRPGIKAGLPLEEAIEKAANIEEEIRALVKSNAKHK